MPEKHIRIFLSSPGDVAAERDIVRELIKDALPVSAFVRDRATFDVISWDDPNAAPGLPAHLTPQKAINRKLSKPSECDIVIVILWGRMGTPLPADVTRDDGTTYQSGTEWEFEDALNAAKENDKPATLVYRRTEEPKIGAKDPKALEKLEQYQKVEAFFARFQDDDGSLKESYSSYANLDDFRDLLRQQLESQVNELLEATKADAIKASSRGARSLAAGKAPIFVSYARSDGKPTADDLRQRLQQSGFQIWQDLVELEGGKDWWRQITEAIDQVKSMILVMTSAALASDDVRREWHYARRRGVNVIPVIGEPNLNISSLPGWMRRVHFGDPNDDNQWNRLLQTLEAPGDVPRVPFMVDDLPENFVPRPNELEELIGKLLDESRAEPIAITAALRGAGGYGKTTLARAICHDKSIQDAFSDGVLWVTVGEDPGELTGRVIDLIHTLTGEREAFETSDAAVNRFKELLADRRMLVVIDDAWNGAHLRPFLEGGPNCARLITTRFATVLPKTSKKTQVDAMQIEEAIDLLYPDAPPDALIALRELAQCLGEWPLMLNLAGGVLREQIELGASHSDAISFVSEALREEGLTAFDARDSDAARDQAAALTLEMSLKRLEETRRSFEELAVFPEDVDVPFSVLEIYWELSAYQVTKLCQRFYQLGLLLSLDMTRRYIRLHDVIRAYLRPPNRDIQALDAKLVEAYRKRCGGAWHASADDGYFFQYLPWHLHGADRADELQMLLFDYRWLRRKLAEVGVNPVIDDLERFGGDGEAGTLASTVRISAHVLGQAPEQLGGQLWGRLKADEGPCIERLLADARKQAERPALVPCRPTLPGHGKGLIRTLASHSGGVNAVAITPDGTRAVSGSGDKTLKVWDLATGAVTATLEGHSDRVNALAITPDGTRAVSGSHDRTLKVWDLATGAVTATLEGHNDRVNAVAITPDGTCAVSGSYDDTLKVWDLAAGAVTTTLEGHNDRVNAVAITPDGTRAVSGSYDQTLKVWDLTTGAVTMTLEGHNDWVSAVAITPDGTCVVSGSGDKTLKVWDLAAGVVTATLEGHSSRVKALAITPDGTHAVSGSWDKTLKVWDLATGAAMATFEGHDWVNAVAITPDGTRAVSGSEDQTLKVWDLATGAVTATLEGHSSVVWAMAITPDGARAVSGSGDKTLKVWDLATGAVTATLEGHSDWVIALAISPDGTRAVSGSYDQSLKVWDLATGAVTATLEGHSSRVNAVTISPDGTRAVSGSGDKTLKVWDLATGAVTATLEGHSSRVNAVAITPDGTRAVSGSGDKTLKVWDLASGEEIVEFCGDATFPCCTVTSDGRFVVAGDAAGRVHLLEILA